jgi:uncharacterized protein YegP (UPF0339 family)
MRIELFKDKNKECRIRLVAKNNKIIMTSEAYSSKAKAKKTIKSILKISSFNFIDLVN